MLIESIPLDNRIHNLLGPNLDPGVIICMYIEIVRRTDSEEGVYHYGAVFIVMTDTDALKIDIYQIFNDL